MTVLSMLANGTTLPIGDDSTVIDIPAGNLGDIVSVKVPKIDHPSAIDAKILLARVDGKKYTLQL